MRQKLLITILLLLSVVAPLAALADSFKVNPADLELGKEATLQFVLDNPEKEYYGFQAEVKLPAGLTAVESTAQSAQKGELDMTLSDRAKDGEYQMNSNKRSDGSLIIGAFSANHKPISENNGVLVELKVNVATDFNGGDVVVSNIKFITAENKDEKLADATTTLGVKVTGLTLDETDCTLRVGGTVTLTATVTPASATNYTVDWSSTKEEVAIVENGVVTAKGLGETTITATCGSLTATCVVTVEETPVESISFTRTSLTLKPGGTATLIPNFTPEEPTDKTVTWTSSKTAVATVDDNGKVTAVIDGETTITATTTNGKTATCVVTVKSDVIDVEKISLDKTELNLKPEETASLKATITPTNASDQSVHWSSSKPSVASVDEKGNITALTVGTTTITAEASNGLKATCTVTVDPILATSVTLSETTSSLKVGETVTLTATVAPDNTTDKTMVWTSSDATIASVKDGVVTAIALGEATITATCGTVSATCKVSVVKTPVESINLDKNELSLTEGDTETLNVTVAPDDATYKSVTWTSSDEAVATVDATGKVTAIKAGSVTITATADNKSVTCKVTVVAKVIAVTGITLDKTTLSLTEGDTETLKATVTPDDATDKTVTWTSSDATIATVENGVVTAVKAGTATITATASGKTATCVVTVSAKIIEATEIILSATTAELKVGETVTLTAEVAPENATIKTVTWTSSDEAVATVDANGKVIAKALGEATITVACGNAKATCKVKVVEPFEVTASWWHQWDGFGADAKILEETEKIFTSNLGVAQKQGDHIIGDSACDGDCYADLSEYGGIEGTGTSGITLRLYFNRTELQGGEALDIKVDIKEDGTYRYDFSELPGNPSYVHLNFVKTALGWQGGKWPEGLEKAVVETMKVFPKPSAEELAKKNLTEVIDNASHYDGFAKTEDSFKNLTDAIAVGNNLLTNDTATADEINKAIAAIQNAIEGLKLQPGYLELTKEMFKHYSSVADPGEGEATGCDYNLFEKNGNTYGDGANVGYLNWADLTNYDKLIIKASGNPRFCMNRQADGGQQKETMEESKMIDIQAGGDNWSTNRYLTSDGDVYTVDIAKIIDDYGFARLHAIKYPWGQDGIATYMYLYKDPNAAKEHKLTFDIDDPAHVVIKVNGEEITDLKAGANEKNVADRANLTISPAESFKLTSVIAGDDVYVKLIDGTLTKTVVKNISFEIKTENADPLAQPKKELTEAIESAKLYDSFAKTEESFNALTDAIAAAETALAAETATEESLATAGNNIDKAIEGLTLEEGYSKLTPEMFKKYASAEEPGEGEVTDCVYELFKTSRMLYGANNETLKWADLSKYDQLIVTTVGEGDLPRFCMNDEVSTKFEINPYGGSNEATEAYQTVEGNAYIIDLKKIVKDNAFAHLHSIQVNGWGTGALVNGMYLYKKPYVAATGIALDKTEITKVVYGEEVKLTAIVEPVDATDPIFWISSDDEVATVDEDGNVTVVGVGNATITASCGDFIAECVFECYPQIGDANWDGKIDVTDAVDIVNYVVEKKDIPDNNVEEWTKFYVAGANVNNDKDGKITFADASAAVKLALDQPAASSTQNRVIAAYDVESQDALVIGGISAADGRIFVPVTLDNSMEYVALQADIILPEGMNVEVKEGSRIAGSHILATKKFADNHIRVALYNLGNTAFADNNAPIIEIFADGMISDNEEIEISNIIAADTDANRFVLASKTADTTGVDALGFDGNAPVKVYDLNGRYISDKVEGLEEGFYIIRQGNNAKKVRIR